MMARVIRTSQKQQRLNGIGFHGGVLAGGAFAGMAGARDDVGGGSEGGAGVREGVCVVGGGGSGGGHGKVGTAAALVEG